MISTDQDDIDRRELDDFENFRARSYSGGGFVDGCFDVPRNDYKPLSQRRRVSLDSNGLRSGSGGRRDSRRGEIQSKQTDNCRESQTYINGRNAKLIIPIDCSSKELHEENLRNFWEEYNFTKDSTHRRSINEAAKRRESMAPSRARSRVTTLPQMELLTIKNLFNHRRKSEGGSSKSSGIGQSNDSSLTCNHHEKSENLSASKSIVCSEPDSEDHIHIHRLRSFSITRKGLVDNGYEENGWHRNSSIQTSYDLKGLDDQYSGLNKQNFHRSSNCVSTDADDMFEVWVLGASGTGKSTLLRQFYSPDYCAFVDEDKISLSGDVKEQIEEQDVSSRIEGGFSLTLSLDGEQSTMFIRQPLTSLSSNVFEQTEPDMVKLSRVQGRLVDACVVVYSVEDRKSFEKAVDWLYAVREFDSPANTTALILVANKTDIVRSRVVLQEEGLSMAQTYRCKYVELSAEMGLNVDRLLVGTLKQVRLKRQQLVRSNSDTTTRPPLAYRRTSLGAYDLRSPDLSIPSGRYCEGAVDLRGRLQGRNRSAAERHRDAELCGRVEGCGGSSGLGCERTQLGMCCLKCARQKVLAKIRRKSSSQASSACDNLYEL